MAWRQRQSGVEICKCLSCLAKLRAGGAAVEQGIAMTRVTRKRFIERGDGLPRPLEREQCVAAVVERVDIAGVQGERLVERVERLAIALEGVQHIGEVNPGVGDLHIHVEGRTDEAMRLAELSALRFTETGQ